MRWASLGATSPLARIRPPGSLSPQGVGLGRRGGSLCGPILSTIRVGGTNFSLPGVFFFFSFLFFFLLGRQQGIGSN
jgi:hypothetical protein